jgi:glycosyltransferase involved in cell wall biosynthesis
MAGLSAHPRVVALISAYNESDIIAPVIGHLVENGVWVYLIDNQSTDDTAAQAAEWLGRGVLGIESFPPRPASDGAARFSWRDILRRKQELTRELDADWFMHHDADEIREPPWPDCTLAEAIGRVDSLGYNCIDFHVFTFPPVDDSFRRGMDPKEHFALYQRPAWFDFLQRKCWKSTGEPVSLMNLGGHDVRFNGRRVFPIRFVMRHYPIRGQRHGARKVFAERKPRFVPEERRVGWHQQYDRIEGEDHCFLADRASLMPFDADEVRAELLAGQATAIGVGA